MPSPRILPRLANRLRELRKRAGLTQEQFAERAQVGYKFYQQIETNARRDLRLSTLERLADAHGISVAELLSDRPPEGAARRG
ncbi:MAG: helix-turn-helix domain-containing protein [Candidatus Udaeobacter sp.]